MPLITTSQMGLQNVNPFGSNFAQQYGWQNTKLVQDRIRYSIYDATPQQFYELWFVNNKQPMMIPSDEFSYLEFSDQQQAVITPVLGSNILAGTTQVIPVSNISDVAPNRVITYPDNVTKGMVTYIDPTASTITVSAYTNSTLPELLAASSPFTFPTPFNTVADGSTVLPESYRLSTYERYNYAQILYENTNMGWLEMQKYLANGTTDYLQKQNEQMFMKYRISESNMFWMGVRAQAPTQNGIPAKMCGGVEYMMQQAGSIFTTATTSTLVPTLYSVASATNYKPTGAFRYLMGTDDVLRPIADYFKANSSGYGQVKFESERGGGVHIELDYVNLFSERWILVPMNAFKQRGSYPPNWASRLFLADLDSTSPVYWMPEYMGYLPSMMEGAPNQNLSTSTWVLSVKSFQFDNPLGWAVIDVTL